MHITLVKAQHLRIRLLTKPRRPAVRCLSLFVRLKAPVCPPQSAGEEYRVPGGGKLGRPGGAELIANWMDGGGLVEK